MRRRLLLALVVAVFVGCGNPHYSLAEAPFQAAQKELVRLVSDDLTPEQILADADYLTHMEAKVKDPRLGEIIYIMAGFVYEEDNGRQFVITASHIKPVGGEILEISAYFHNHEQRPEFFKLIGYDRRYDTAVLAPANPEFRFTGRVARFGISAEVRRNMPVVALGSPAGLPYQYAAGRVLYANKRVTVHGMPYPFTVIEHNARTGRGFSGGPTLNMQGEVIGMEVAGYNSRNLVLADSIPIDDIKAILPDLIAGAQRD